MLGEQRETETLYFLYFFTAAQVAQPILFNLPGNLGSYCKIQPQL